MLISRKMNPSPKPSSLHILQFLVTQGIVGEGDKEIFLTAANMLNEPFYQDCSPTLGCHKNGLWVHSPVPPWSNTIPSTTTLPRPIKRRWGTLVSHFSFMQTSPSSTWPRFLSWAALLLRITGGIHVLGLPWRMWLRAWEQILSTSSGQRSAGRPVRVREDWLVGKDRQGFVSRWRIVIVLWFWIICMVLRERERERERERACYPGEMTFFALKHLKKTSL